MSFVDYQKQIEIVSDPAVVEEWKEQARNVTTFTTTTTSHRSLSPTRPRWNVIFARIICPGCCAAARSSRSTACSAGGSPDRALGRAIEDAWSHETRSPSQMMQELASGFRHAGLNIFRHRRGMLFVSPIRSRPFSHELTGVSPRSTPFSRRLPARRNSPKRPGRKTCHNRR